MAGLVETDPTEALAAAEEAAEAAALPLPTVLAEADEAEDAEAEAVAASSFKVLKRKAQETIKAVTAPNLNHVIITFFAVFIKVFVINNPLNLSTE